MQDAFWGILIPFLGTSLGAGCVFFLKKSLSDGIQRALTGFAAGVMVAASVWSLLIPAMEQAADLGRLAFSLQRWASGWASCFCCCWIILFRICTRIVCRPKGQKANSNALR